MPLRGGEGTRGRRGVVGAGLALTRTVRISEQAASDLAGIERWFTQPGSGVRAARRLQHIFNAIDELAEHPCLHARNKRSEREFSVEGHRVRYRVRPDTSHDATAGDVLILRVFGPGQDRTQQ